jgi:hypothetical protein
VFIAANIVDDKLIRGEWGESLRGLVELIGRERVAVSVYGGPKVALESLGERLGDVQKFLVGEEEEPLNMSTIPRTTLPTGETKVKRIAYLAEVRNKALEPLGRSENKFDKVLFINDVFFDPIDAARLLWGTNVNKEGKAVYKAVCGTDFIKSWKFYDTFATRDAEGFSIGVPIFPWFANVGDAVSRRDVLEGREAVRVKSCWGGMVAFDGRYFQDSGKLEEKYDVEGRKEFDRVLEEGKKHPPQLPLRFRSEPEPFWDSSECCLIHADIMASAPYPPLSSFASTSIPDPSSTTTDQSASRGDDKYDTGIYMNPYVRVTYDRSTKRWLGFAKRFERLFTPVQRIINHFAHMPHFNVRRMEVEGQLIRDRKWVSLTAKTADDTTPVSHEFGGEDATWQGSGVEKKGNRLGKKDLVGKPKGKEYWTSEGYYTDFNRTANRGGYCGVRQLLVVKEDAKEGESNWDNLLDRVPPLEDWVRQ